jgi:ribosome-associated toxin RatA of RatAB toxin-antitoxin module
MRTVDRIRVRAAIDRVFAAAAAVERWPDFLPHYRRVRMLERRATGGTVEMAAWRPFGMLRYPVWWVSEMEVRSAEYAIRYRHVRGITRGMDVEWRLKVEGSTTNVVVVHEWTGPRWPLIGRWAARRVIGPVFIHHIASLTLAGIRRRAEEV